MSEGIEKKKLPVDALRDGLREVAFADSWKESLGKVLDTIHSAESLFTFTQLNVINENFPRIEIIMKELNTLGSTHEDDRRKNELRAEKAELIGGLPKDYDIREIVARVTEVAREDIDRVYEMQDKRRLREYEEKAKE